MQSVDKKHRKSFPRLRALLLALSMAALALCLALYCLAGRGDGSPQPSESAALYGSVNARTESEVMRIEISLLDGDGWTLTRQGDGFVMEDDPELPLDAFTVDEIVYAVAPLFYNEILTENAADYAAHWSDFGLDSPACTVTVDYADGERLVFCIGAVSQSDTPFYYMTVEGDPRLYALNTSSASALMQQRRALRSVTQPTIYRALLDSIRIVRPDASIVWTLEGSPEASDAIDHWLLTEPIRYPVDGQRMSTLQKNLENVRLGVYVCEATPETLSQYGFDTPRLVLETHMAAGSLGTVSKEGVWDVTNHPESSVTLTVGGAESDVADWVLYDGSIYVASHFTYSPFFTVQPASTLSRYPVLTALGNLKALTVETAGRTDRYTLTHTERVAENNQLLYDDGGDILYDTTVEKNGVPMRYESFEQAYSQLVQVTVSGTLDNGNVSVAAPHTVYTFEDVAGTVHTVALSDADILHDVVTVDGVSLYYLIKGGMAFDPVTP